VLDTSLCTVLLLYYTVKLYHRVIDVFWNTFAATLEVWKLNKDPTLGKHHPPWDRLLRRARRGQWRSFPEPSQRSVHNTCLPLLYTSEPWPRFRAY